MAARMTLKRVNEIIAPTGLKLTGADGTYYVETLPGTDVYLAPRDKIIKMKSPGRYTEEQWLADAWSRVERATLSTATMKKNNVYKAVFTAQHVTSYQPKFKDYTNPDGSVLINDNNIVVVTTKSGFVTRWVACIRCGLVTATATDSCPCSKK